MEIIIAAESRAPEILAGKRHTLDALAKALMKEEMLESADVERIIQGSRELGSRRRNLDSRLCDKIKMIRSIP